MASQGAHLRLADAGRHLQLVPAVLDGQYCLHARQRSHQDAAGAHPAANPSLDNFRLVIKAAPGIWRWGINTLFVALVTMGLHVLFDAMSGYGFAKRRFPGSGMLFWLVIGAMMIPTQVTLVPLYIMVTQVRNLPSSRSPPNCQVQPSIIAGIVNYGGHDRPRPGRRPRHLPDEAVHPDACRPNWRRRRASTAHQS